MRLRPNTFIGHYEGPRTRRDGIYVLWVEDERGKPIGIDGKNELRFVNHSRTPNAVFWGDALFTLRNVQPGTELTFDYGDEWGDSE